MSSPEQSPPIAASGTWVPRILRGGRKRSNRVRPAVEVLETRVVPSAIKFSPPSFTGTGISPVAAAVGDFNSDGYADVAVAEFGTSRVRILDGNGTGALVAAGTVPTGAGPRSVVAGDVDGDGTTDLVLPDRDGNSVTVLRGNGDNTFTRADYVVGRTPWYAALADLNQDGQLDIAVANSADNTLSVLINRGDGTFLAPTTYQVGQEPLYVTAADFDGDGSLDLAAANFGSFSNSVSLLLNDGTGSFASRFNYFVGDGPISIATADFNSDGTPDLAVALNRAGAVAVLLSQPGGGFAGPADYATGAGPQSVVTADFDEDGAGDLVTANSNSGSLTILKGRPDGQFTTQADQNANGNPTFVVTADLNDDGLPDLVTTYTSSSQLGILLNETQPALPSIAVSDTQVAEGNAGTRPATFVLTLSEAAAVPVTVDFRTADGTATAEQDYGAVSGTVTFAPGDVSQTVSISVYGDTVFEPSETFFLLLSNPTNASLNDSSGECTIFNDDPANGVVAKLVAFRPQTDPFDWRIHQVGASRQATQGAGIRINNDDDNHNGTPDRLDAQVTGEDDLVMVEVHATPGVSYTLSRGNARIRVWSDRDKRTAILGENNRAALRFDSGTSLLWVEYVSLDQGTATLELKAKDGSGHILARDEVLFYSFDAVVIVLGGRGQTPGDPPPKNFGTFRIASDLYDEGYDVHMYNQGEVSADGLGRPYQDVLHSARSYGERQVAIMGYSYGGSATVALAGALVSHNPHDSPLTISFTAYIDAVSQTGVRGPETRLPPGSRYHVNYYQRHWNPLDEGGLRGDAVDGAQFNLNVNDTPWGTCLRHYEIDDQREVQLGIEAFLAQQVPVRAREQVEVRDALFERVSGAPLTAFGAALLAPRESPSPRRIVVLFDFRGPRQSPTAPDLGDRRHKARRASPPATPLASAIHAKQSDDSRSTWPSL